MKRSGSPRSAGQEAAVRRALWAPHRPESPSRNLQERPRCCVRPGVPAKATAPRVPVSCSPASCSSATPSPSKSSLLQPWVREDATPRAPKRGMGDLRPRRRPKHGAPSSSPPRLLQPGGGDWEDGHPVAPSPGIRAQGSERVAGGTVKTPTGAGGPHERGERDPPPPLPAPLGPVPSPQPVPRAPSPRAQRRPAALGRT